MDTRRTPSGKKLERVFPTKSSVLKPVSESHRELVEKAIQQLEGAFACCFKSKAFPGELVATRRGSPLLVAIKSQGELNADYIPIQYR